MLRTHLITQRMSEEFLTIKEAATTLDKAEITVRRFVQRVVKGSDVRRRALIKPSPEELQQHTDGPPPAWRISTKLLREQFPTTGQGSEPNSATPSTTEAGRVVEILQSQNTALQQQLGVKDGQIESLTTLVHSLGGQLNERLKESNILMKGLQDRLALPERVSPPTIEVQPVEQKLKPRAAKRPEKREAKKDEPRPGWFQRLLSGGDKPAT